MILDISSRIRRPFEFLIFIFGIYFTLSVFQRVIYFIWIYLYSENIVSHFLTAFTKGLLFDLISGVFLLASPILVFTFLPSRWVNRRHFRIFLGTLTSLCLLFAFFMALAEGFFFAEFHARYNFIAVDYLVYSHEVLHQALESFPVFWILGGLFLFWLPIFIFVTKKATELSNFTLTLKQRSIILFFLILIPSSLFFFDEDNINGGETYWSREISKNTLFALFSAYNRNSINFHQFYATLDTPTASHLTHEWLEEETGEDLDHLEADTENENSIIRNIISPIPQKKWNVILVVIESMSARYMGKYGGPNERTPNLDRLAGEGIFFTNLYATGTRTVRGLEALILSLPPTPGQSILRRPNSGEIFNLGAVLNQKGYKSQFIYGGYSYFDNMQEWFQTNGFEVIDRSSFPSEEIHFGNVWGVCDEDLFDQVLKQADLLHGQDKQFFQTVLTTSNHRPYTYPEGRIDIPSHTGRSGAVKYTDFSIGRFVDMAKTKPWFSNTLFVFVADHNGSVAGGADIPIQDYLIPMIFYNPNLVEASEVEKLGSQIDFAPTLLGLMGVSYQSRFFGQNLFKAKAGRAVLGTYQKVALMKPNKMTILGPNKYIESQDILSNGNVVYSESVTMDQEKQMSDEIRQTISIYQTASDLFQSGESKLSHQFPTQINVRSF